VRNFHGTKVLGLFAPRERMFHGTKVTRERKFSLYGLFAPGNESAEERKGQIPYKRCLSCMQLLAFLAVQGVLYLKTPAAIVPPTVREGRRVIGQPTVQVAGQ